MNTLTYTKEKNMPSQTFFNNAVKETKIEDDGTTVTYESSTAINEEELRAVKEIVNALIFCFSFWFVVIAFIVLFF